MRHVPPLNLYRTLENLLNPISAGAAWGIPRNCPLLEGVSQLSQHSVQWPPTASSSSGGYGNTSLEDGRLTASLLAMTRSVVFGESLKACLHTRRRVMETQKLPLHQNNGEQIRGPLLPRLS